MALSAQVGLLSEGGKVLGKEGVADWVGEFPGNRLVLILTRTRVATKNDIAKPAILCEKQTP